MVTIAYDILLCLFHLRMVSCNDTRDGWEASRMTNGVAADMEASRTSRPTERHD